ncbi:MAG: phage tail tape measure protein [Ruminococcus sp.]|nr:phage tail tape measure protein [Ruminococcus sp.]
MANRIKGITVEINGDTTKLSKSLEGVNKNIRSTQSQLKDVEKLLKLDPTNTELLSQKQKLLADAVSSTKEKLETLKTAAEQANTALANGDISQEQYDALQREIIETEQELQSLEQQAKQSGTALTQMAQTGEKLKTVGTNISNAGQALLPLTGVVMGLGTAAVKTGMDFDAAMSKVSSVSGATGDELQALRDKAREMGSKTKFSASEAAEAMNYMAMAGWKTTDMLSGIDGVMNLAAASGEDLATTSDIVTDALTAFGLTAADSGHFADVLAAASSNANTNVSMMGETFKYAAPVAGSLGFSVEDTAEAIGLMANAGIKSTQAGTSLRSVMTALAGEVKICGESLGEVEIQTTNADGSMRELSDILADCRTAFSGLSESEQASAAQALVGKNAMSGFLALMNAAPADIEKLSGAISDCDGTSLKMAETMQDNLAGQLTILQSALQELAISFSDILMPTVRDIVSKIQSLVDKFNSLDEKTKTIIAKVAVFAAALGPALIVTGKLTSGIGTVLSILPKLAAAMGGLPVLAITAAIAGLVGAFLAFEKSGKSVEEFFSGLQEKLSSFLSSVNSFISENLPGIISSFLEIIPEFAAFASEFITSLIGFITELLPQLISVAVALINTLLQGLISALPALIDGALQIINALVTGITQNLPIIVNSALQIIQSLLNTIVQNLPLIINAALQLITSLVNGITQNLPLITNSATTMINTLVTAITTQLPQIIEAALQIVTTLVQSIMDNLPQIVQAALDLITTLAQSLLDNLPIIIETVLNLILTIVGTIIDNLPMIIDAAFQIITALVTGLIDSIPQILSAVWGIVKSIISEFLSGDWLDTGVKILQSLLDGILSMVSGILSSIGDLAGQMLDKLLELGSDMLDVGKNIVEGLWDGISGAAGWLMDQIANFCSSIWDEVCDFFEIASPSKLFKKELGFNLVYGLAEGIDGKAETAVNAVNSMGNEVMKAAEKSLQADWNLSGFGNVPVSNSVVNNYYNNDNSRTVNQTNNSPKALSRLEIYRLTRNAVNT